MTDMEMYKAAFVIAAIDIWLAVVCAIGGSPHFATFMVLAGFMWAYGLYIKPKE